MGWGMCLATRVIATPEVWAIELFLKTLDFSVNQNPGICFPIQQLNSDGDTGAGNQKDPENPPPTNSLGYLDVEILELVLPMVEFGVETSCKSSTPKTGLGSKQDMRSGKWCSENWRTYKATTDWPNHGTK